MALSAQQRRMAQLIYGVARQRGLNDARARELVAASYAESGLNPAIRNKSSGATGLFQLLSSGYVRRAQALGGVTNPRANLLSILPDYVSYWRSHPGAAPGQAAAAVERSGEGAGFYANPLRLLGNLGGGSVPAGAGAPAAPPPDAGGAPAPDLRQLKFAALQQLLSQTGAKHPDYSGFLESIRNLRQTQAAAQEQTAIGPPAPAGQRPRPSGPVKFSGQTLAGLNPDFLRAFQAAVRAAGGTQVRINSGYRSPVHNAAVGGVPHSRHLTGKAVDAEVFIPTRGWVPAGVALQGVAPRYGLRSGNQPGFYRGGRDPVHVDYGNN